MAIHHRPRCRTPVLSTRQPFERPITAYIKLTKGLRAHPTISSEAVDRQREVMGILEVVGRVQVLVFGPRYLDPFLAMIFHNQGSLLKSPLNLGGETMYSAAGQLTHVTSLLAMRRTFLAVHV